MILIITNQTDISTCDVIDWISYFKKPFIRLNKEDRINLLEVDLQSSDPNLTSDFMIKCNINGNIKLSEVKAYWYRKGGLPRYKYTEDSEAIFKSRAVAKEVRSNLICEVNSLYEYLHFLLDQVKIKIGSRENADICKLKQLYLAKKIGLQIPESAIITTKSALKRIKEKYFSLITKGIQEVLSAQDDNVRYLAYTEKIDEEQIKGLPETFFPSFIQKQIEKAYELRVFYLNGELYPMAIFSQSSEQTSVDFRKYNKEKPNRNVPYRLPDGISAKLVKLMKKLKLETGSIDLIVTLDHEYVFLEVNPVGQFGMTSYPCNYYLEKKIAQRLIDYA